MKRAFDVAVSGMLLLVSAPLFLVCALAVRLTSPGPVLFGHTRCGRGGKPFACLKFRTMVRDAEAWLAADPGLREEYRRNGFKLPRRKDPRVTRVGHLLRFTHLDELPQLLNVLRGDMSMVGPRPVVREELEWYEEGRELFLSMTPGIFGAWTALGRRRPEYPRRVEVELSYSGPVSLLRDLGILFRNLPVVLTGQVDEDDPAPAPSRRRDKGRNSWV